MNIVEAARWWVEPDNKTRAEYMTKQEFHQYMRNQVKEISGYREKLTSRYQRDVTRNEAAFRWIKEFAEDFNAEYLKKLPKPTTHSFRRR